MSFFSASQMNYYPSRSNFSKPKARDLNLDEVLIVTKISECQENKASVSKDGGFITEVDEEQEKFMLAEEQEAILKKQQQLLLADERGKQALTAEIAGLKKNQEKRAEVIRNRQHALNVERERARWVALLPPPLPKSVKVLLQKQGEESSPHKPDVKMPDELTAISMTGSERKNEENKENILGPKEMEAQRKMQEEWNLKAQKRFNEALKKDRQTEECARIMKQVQSAELQNRREMAKSLASENVKTVPCPLSDKFQTAKNQIDMEDAAEKILKKSKREHAIDDIEGYQDHYEIKYKSIDSEFEEKMIDCVPNFIKENYEYLLEDDSKFSGGKNFSGFNDSGTKQDEDVLNQAYIETPPYDEGGNIPGKFDLVIDKLDDLRSTFEAEYNQKLKPLLVAAAEIPKKLSADKAIGTEFSQPSAEDKAVETDLLVLMNDYQKIDPMVFQRSRPQTFLPPYEMAKIPAMHQKPVYFKLPDSPQMNSSTPSWSSTSYCSLPSKHGFPHIPGSAESVKCDICAAEKDIQIVSPASNGHPVTASLEIVQKNDSPDYNAYKIPSLNHAPLHKPSSSDPVVNSASNSYPVKVSLETAQKKDSPDYNTYQISSLNHAPSHKPSLSEYVKELAKKYLEGNKYTNSAQSWQSNASELSPVVLAFEKKKIDSDEARNKPPKDDSNNYCLPNAIYRDSDNVFPTNFSPSERGIAVSNVAANQKFEVKESFDRISRATPDANRILNVSAESSKDLSLDTDDLIDEVYQSENKGVKIIDQLIDPASPSNFDSERERLQAIQQVLSRRFPRFDFRATPKEEEDSQESDSEDVPVSLENGFQKEMRLRPHIYHELSTIHEVDSAVTAGSLQLSRSNLEKSSEKNTVGRLQLSQYLDKSLETSIKDKSVSEVLDKSGNKLKSISLLDPPSAEISELAKSIKFVAETETKPEEVTVESPVYCLTEQSSVVPSPISSSDSSSSSIATSAKAFSSSFVANHKNHPFLQSTGSLPKFTRNVSDVKSKNFFSSPSMVESPASSSLGSTPEITAKKSSLLSSVGSKKKQITNNEQGFTSPHTLMSGFISNNQSDFDPANNSDFNTGGHESNNSAAFQPMTPESDVSTPMMVDKYNTRDYESQASVTNGSFQPMHLHSDVSSPSTALFDHKKNGEADSKESFKPLTPHSNVSTPYMSAFNAAKHASYASSSEESFKPMSLASSVSSPSDFEDNGTGLNPGKHNVNSHLNPQFKELVQSDQQKVTKNKTHRYLAPFTSNSKPTASELKMNKAPAMNSRSGHDFSVQKVNKQLRSLKAAFSDDLASHPENVLSDNLMAQSCDASSDDALIFKNNTAKPQAEKYSESDQSSRSSSESSEVLKRKVQDIPGKDKSQSIQRQPNLYRQVLSSTSSSSENLSDMFSGSKINYQSTPIKSLEQEMEDAKLISDESLTLVTVTQYTCRPESPENFLNPSNPAASSQVVGVVTDSNVKIHHITDSDCRTPTNQSPHLGEFTDTPSMISFLHHENNCLGNMSSPESPLPGINQDPKSSIDEDSSTPKCRELSQLQKFPQADYKQRTKRLWSNLEEVKKKNSTQERQKRMMLNRLKAKEYAKKLTPKRKI